MKPESNTPRTDIESSSLEEVVSRFTDSSKPTTVIVEGMQMVRAEVARLLETELAEAKREIKRIKSLEGYRELSRQIVEALEQRDSAQANYNLAHETLGKYVADCGDLRKEASIIRTQNLRLVEALRYVHLAFEKFGPDEDSRYGMAWAKVSETLSLLAEEKYEK